MQTRTILRRASTRSVGSPPVTTKLLALTSISGITSNHSLTLQMARPDVPCYDFAEEIRQVIQMTPESQVNVASNKLGAAGRTQAI